MQLIIAIFFLLIPSVLNLNCYVCNSNEDANCENGYNLGKFQQTCRQTIEPYCRKIIQTVNKQSSIIRTCGSKIGTKACYKTAGVNNANVCSCNEDLCNNARNLNQEQRFISLISSFLILGITMFILR